MFQSARKLDNSSNRNEIGMFEAPTTITIDILKRITNNYDDNFSNDTDLPLGIQQQHEIG